MSSPEMRDNQASSAMRDATLSRRDMLWAGAALAVGAAFAEPPKAVAAAVFSPFIAKQSAMVPRLRPAVMLPGCGHWTQQERAPEVSAAMIDFLRRL
jgi:pimeloyl-ACP methyl ester carboxylesterase